MTSKYQHDGERSYSAEQREGPRQHDEQSDPTEVAAEVVGDSTNGQVLDHGGNKQVRLTNDFQCMFASSG